MKKVLLTLIIFSIALPNVLNAQDRSTLRAAVMSFDSAEKNHKAGNYEQAAQEYTIVLNSIPVSIESRRHLEIRLQSVIGLVDIHYHKITNFNKACEYVQLYLSDMKVVKSGKVLRASDRLDFLKKEQEYVSNYLPKCHSYEGLDSDADKFRKHFDEELRKIE